MPKANPIAYRLYMWLHRRDDYMVKANSMHNHTLEESYYTTWMFRAFWKYIQFHFKYPEHTITLVHHKYPE